MLHSSTLAAHNAAIQPKVVVIRRRPNQGFGFTLRHFIAYPPEDDPAWLESAKRGIDTSSQPSYQIKGMETIFIKEVQPNGPAYHANLKTGDRVLMVNNKPIAGISYGTIVSMIKQTPTVLTLHVVPKECDVLQMHYDSIAHTPESNRPPTNLSADAMNALRSNMTPQQMISMPAGSINSALVRDGNGFRPIMQAISASGAESKLNSGSQSLDYGDIAQGLQQYSNQRKMYATPNDFSCQQTINVSVLPNQHQHQQQEAVVYAPYVGNNIDLMVRLRESIKQKEEFLKSPIPQGNQQHQHFFSSNESPQSSRISSSTSSKSVVPFNQIGARRPSPQLKSLVTQPLSSCSTINSSTSNSASFKDTFTNTCNMSNFYSSKFSDHYEPNSRAFKQKVGSTNEMLTQSSSGNSVGSRNGLHVQSRYGVDFECGGPLQETGVTNKVFERKLVSTFSKGFDPFKPLSINTNPLEANTSSESAIKKSTGVLYETSKLRPFQSLQVQQSQYHQQQSNQQNFGRNLQLSHELASSVDGQQSSRMEIHKANLASTVYADSPRGKYCGTFSERNDVKNLAKTVTNNEAPIAKEVVRRAKSTTVETANDNKPMRRISYLRATNNDDLLHSETSSTHLNSSKASSTTATTIDESSCEMEDMNAGEPIYDIVAGGHEFIETSHGIEETKIMTISLSANNAALANTNLKTSMHIEKGSSNDHNAAAKDLNDLEKEMELFETEMEIKSSCINGKRISDYRSWKQVKIEIKGDSLKIYPNRSSKSDSNVIELDIRNFKFFDESIDKKKYIFRMQSKPTHLASWGNELNIEETPEKLASLESNSNSSNLEASQLQTDILFKTKNSVEMKRIFGLLQWKNSLLYDNEVPEKQLAEPQKIAATSSITTSTFCDDQQLSHLQPDQAQASSSTRYENDISNSTSPSMKTRKSSSHKNIPDKELGSPKTKNWKDLLFRRGGGTGNNSDILGSHLAKGNIIGSIGVPLKSCPMSKNNEFVPHIVDICTNIVETKGLGVVGIYRIPGNKAAISELSEQVNKPDFSWDRCNTDVRWEDVNVVSSLLKLFIRSLPDALLPSSFYNNFIEADKKTGLLRLKELKDLLESLPRHSYETLKHIIRHLSRVSRNCEVNLMEPKNLAIIFGPSIIRTPNDTLEIAVKDMKHQCRIVELLVTQYDYFFENGEMPNIADVSGNNTSASVSGETNTSGSPNSQEEQTNMLLHNVSKIERLSEKENSKTSRFIPQLRRRTQSKRGGVSSDTYSGESLLSLDCNKSSSRVTNSGSSSSTNVAITSSSSSSTGHFNKITSTVTSKKKERIAFLGTRSHLRKASLDEKDSGSGSGNSCTSKERGQRSSVDISILLTDDESSNSRLSDTGSMSLTTITDTLDSKLRNLRSGSESNDENDSPDFPKNRRHTLGQPLYLHSENIPYADESPERHFSTYNTLENINPLMLSRSQTTTTGSRNCDNEKELRVLTPFNPLNYKGNKLQHSATMPINANNSSYNSSTPVLNSSSNTVLSVKNPSTPTAGSVRNSYIARNQRFSSSLYEQCCSEDDSEGSTTSDPKESLAIASPSIFQERYNKKRRDHKLFRSASFNCRNYSARNANSNIGTGASNTVGISLTKDEKTDMNLTKKRQIQIKQNRSIKRRHTVGGPHDYSSGTNSGNCTHRCKRNGTGTTTTVLRRISIPSGNANVANNKNNNISPDGSDGSNGNNAATLSVARTSGGGEHVLEVGIRIKNINRSRY